jgi:DNA-binding GntR family transcriptional regulator
MAKLTEEKVQAIRTRFATEVISKEALAREYGVSSEVIRKIIHRTAWTHVL